MEQKETKRAGRILVVALEPSASLYPALGALSRMATVFFLTTPRSEFCESPHRRRLASLRCRFVTDDSPHAALLKLLARHQFETAVIHMRDSVSARALMKDIRLRSPQTKLVIFADQLSLLRPAAAGNAGRNGWLSDHRREFIISKCTAFAQADVVIAGSSGDRRLLRREAGSLNVELVDWNAAGAERRLAAVFAGLAGSVRAPRKLTSIVIPVYGQKKYVRRCIASLRRCTGGLPYELILVDDASPDDTADYLKTVPDARVILNGRNRGFAFTCNRGMREARGEHIVILNSDTVVTPGWLEGMIECAQSNRKIGMVGPRSNTTFGVQQLGQVGYRTLEEMSAWSRVYRMMHRGEWFEAFWLTGFCLLIKREVVARVGLFDERFNRGTQEDYDYCIRVRNAGYRLFCAGDVFVHHYGTRSYTTELIISLNKKNRKIFVEKWGSLAYDFLLESMFYDIAGIPANH